MRPLAKPPVSGHRYVEILDTEEKGSDVNLASFLLLDGFDDEYELAVVISNDSDLSSPSGWCEKSWERKSGSSIPAVDGALSFTMRLPGTGHCVRVR